MSIHIEPALSAMFIRSFAQQYVCTDLLVEIYAKLYEKDSDVVFKEIIESINQKAFGIAKELSSSESATEME